MDEVIYCDECGKPMFIDAKGVSHHIDDIAPGGIDYDADEDHAAFSTQNSGDLA